jgi:GT2 family glycosyltransferase
MISIIICSVTPGAVAQVSQNYAQLLGDEPHEIICIDDATGLAEGYNRGVAQARGDVLLFSHDDLEIISPDFGRRLLGHLRRYDVLGIAGTRLLCNAFWPGMGPPHVYGQVVHPNSDRKSAEIVIFSNASRAVDRMMALDGVLLCAKRRVVDAVPFDDVTFDRFDLYDIDFTYRAFLAGFNLAVCSDLFLMHGSRGVFGEEWLNYARQFDAKHAASLSRRQPRVYRPTTVTVHSRAEMTEVMTPPHWEDK